MENMFLALTGAVNATTEKNETTVHMKLLIFLKRRVKLLLTTDKIKMFSAEDGKTTFLPK